MLILIILLVLVLGGGGGYYGHSRWGYGGGAGIGLGTILLILLVAYLLGLIYPKSTLTWRTRPRVPWRYSHRRWLTAPSDPIRRHDRGAKLLEASARQP